jgi:hypothetical protein
MRSYGNVAVTGARHSDRATWFKYGVSLNTRQVASFWRPLLGPSTDEIVSTSDVPLGALYRVASKLGPEFEVAVDESQVSLRSNDPPSWVTFLAEASWWTQLLSAYAALYVAELVKEAAKETWRSRQKALIIAKAAGNRLRQLADSIADLRSRLSAPTTLGIGLPSRTSSSRRDFLWRELIRTNSSSSLHCSFTTCQPCHSSSRSMPCQRTMWVLVYFYDCVTMARCRFRGTSP